MPSPSSSRLTFLLTAIAIAPFFATAGCTTQQGYQSAQGWQRNQCNKMVDQRDREQCLSKTTTSYEDYKREATKAKE